ncbi:hypothetical protein PHLCEN_2v5896 [Hermanssonia centrifuga]|uniref:Uncharacterized protein n=1 Tax=Hermanssonia centrifuga TaxID=98765 RepID=A0A2R6P167_9APHY|nr:hypothetical protein PHLCEN_2v5896 [Hermanssonia centrifuga]
MDPNAPLTVAQGTLFTCDIYGTFKGWPIGPLAGSSALNGGIAAATFFSLREYIVSPLLLSTVDAGQFSRRKWELEAPHEKQPGRSERLTWWGMRARKLPDAAVSGAITGGVLYTLKRGRRGIIPGAVTASVACSVLQLAYNELGVMRVKYVSQRLEAENMPAPLEPKTPLSQHVLKLFGMHQLSDEDYLEKLKHRREIALRQIAEIEKELKSEGGGTTDTELRSKPP